jgi:hypothetical protein
MSVKNLKDKYQSDLKASLKASAKALVTLLQADPTAPVCNDIKLTADEIREALKQIDYKGHNPDGTPWTIKGFVPVSNTNDIFELTGKDVGEMPVTDKTGNPALYYIQCEEDTKDITATNKYTKEEIREFLKNNRKTALYNYLAYIADAVVMAFGVNNTANKFAEDMQSNHSIPGFNGLLGAFHGLTISATYAFNKGDFHELEFIYFTMDKILCIVCGREEQWDAHKQAKKEELGLYEEG